MDGPSAVFSLFGTRPARPVARALAALADIVVFTALLCVMVKLFRRMDGKPDPDGGWPFDALTILPMCALVRLRTDLLVRSFICRIGDRIGCR